MPKHIEDILKLIEEVKSETKEDGRIKKKM